VTDQTADFMKHECDSVKSMTPNIPTTTNLMCFYPGLDYRVIAKYIDFISLDNYPDWHGDDSDIERSAKNGLINDLMRSLKHKPFVLMECTTSCVNWHSFNKLKRPGVHNLFALQTIAHGSDSVLCFQWRKSRGGSEKLHGALVDHEGSENTRVFREVRALGARLKKLDEIVGTVTESMVAILYDWSNHWALNDARGFCNVDKKMMWALEQVYRALWNKGIDVDIISSEDDFAGYSFIIDPMQYMVSDELGKKMGEYVENGGALLCTYMTGMVSENDLCHLGGFPGCGLRKVFGIWNEEIDTLYPEDSNEVLLADGTTVKAIDYCELIHTEGAKVLGIYNSDFYKGMPAVTVNSYGKGKAYYIAFRENDGYIEKLIDEVLKERGIVSAFDGELPYGVTVHSRTDGETLFVFVENHTAQPQSLKTELAWTNVENGEPVIGSIQLDKRDVIVLKRNL
jgi:beta-galactosidase